MKTNEQPDQDGQKTSEQTEALRNRITANLRVALEPLGGQTKQYWIERPQFIPGALVRGFNTIVANDYGRAMAILNKHIDQVCRHIQETFKDKYDPATVTQAGRLLKSFLGKSQGLAEEVVLISPFDPDNQTPEVKRLIGATLTLSHVLYSGMNAIEFDVILTGIGCSLKFSSSSQGQQGEDLVMFVYLTKQPYCRKTARRIAWPEDLSKL